MRRLSFAGVAVFCALVLTPSGLVLGQAVNIDIDTAGGIGAGAPASTFLGAAVQAGTWNTLSGSQTNNISLLGLNGSPAGVFITRGPTAPIHTFFDSLNTTLDFEKLFDDYQSLSSGSFTMTFTSVDPGWYEVYTYAINPSNSATRTHVTVTGAVAPETQDVGGAMPVNGYAQGVTHSVHLVNVSVAGTINMSFSFGAFGGVLNGLQLKPVSAPPTAQITSPSALGCICGSSAPISGTAQVAAPGSLAYWLLESRPAGGGSWTTVATGFTQVAAALLGNWDTTLVANGFHTLRLTTVNSDGKLATDLQTVFVDKAYDTVAITAPTTNKIVGGVVCVAGSASDQCFATYTVDFAPLPAATPFLPVNPSTPVYATAVTNGTLATWDTVAAGVADASYRIRVMGTDACGNTGSFTRDVIVDNTKPTASISAPNSCSFVGCFNVNVMGTVTDAHLGSWVLEYTGGAAHGWVQIASGASAVLGSTLGTWNTAGLASCTYTLRLRAADTSTLNCIDTNNNTTEYAVTVIRALAGDGNGDGLINFVDITNTFLNWQSVCP